MYGVGLNPVYQTRLEEREAKREASSAHTMRLGCNPMHHTATPCMQAAIQCIQDATPCTQAATPCIQPATPRVVGIAATRPCCVLQASGANQREREDAERAAKVDKIYGGGVGAGDGAGRWKQGDFALVSASVWPEYPCDEQGGRGWLVQLEWVAEVGSSSTAQVRFVVDEGYDPQELDVRCLEPVGGDAEECIVRPHAASAALPGPQLVAPGSGGCLSLGAWVCYALGTSHQRPAEPPTAQWKVALVRLCSPAEVSDPAAFHTQIESATAAELVDCLAPDDKERESMLNSLFSEPTLDDTSWS